MILRGQKLVPGLMIAWGALTAIWVLLAGFFGAYVVDMKHVRTFEYAYVLRDGVTVTRADTPRPLYDLIVPPTETGRPVEFVAIGRHLADLYVHERPRLEHHASDQTRLFLSEKLTAADRTFLLDAYERQRGARRVAWLKIMTGWLMAVVLPPAFLFAIVYLGSRFRFAEPEPPSPEPPRPA